jgi:hypothetical protein
MKYIKTYELFGAASITGAILKDLKSNLNELHIS